MRRGRRLALGVAVVAALVGGAAPARAGGPVCAAPRDAAGGPLPGGNDAADYGAIPESCAGTDLGMRLRGSVLVASANPDFFGDVVATSTLRLRHRIGHSSWTWLSLAADLLTYRYVVNGPVASDGFAFGPPTLGLHRALGDWPLTAATVYARVLLPLDTARESGVRTGFELGVTGRRLVSESGRAGVQGGVAVLAPLVLVGGQTHTSFQPVALAEGWFAFRPRFAVSAGVTARFEVSPDPTFLTLAPRVAARLALRHGLLLALLVEAPVAGEDRTDVIAAFTLAWAAAGVTPASGPPGPSKMLAEILGIAILRRSHGQDKDEVQQQRQEAVQADRQRAREAQEGVPAPLPHSQDVLGEASPPPRWLHQQDAGASDQSDAPVRLALSRTAREGIGNASR